MSEKKCLKCNQLFKSGENYLEVSNNPKAGTYHKECWAEIEKEQQNNNNYHTCQECKKPIKAGEEYAKETMPDAFSPYDVYYHKSCWEKKQGEETPLPGSGKWINNNECSKCGRLAVGGYCQICAVHGNNNNDDDTEREREREREQNQNSQSNKCPKCGKWADSLGCNTSSCENYWKKDRNNNSSSKFKKGNCRQCFKSNVLIDNNGLCFKCVLTNLRLEWKDIIQKGKSEGISLKEMQSEWENTFKPQIEEALRNARQYQAGLTEEEKREGERMAKELIQALEEEVYPERKKGKGGSTWIWILVIGVVAVVGLVGFVWYRKRKK